MTSLLDTALLAARAAAKVHEKWAGRIAAEGAGRKGIGDFVSQADFEAQTAAIEVIRRRHPEHAIMAEEGGDGVLDETGLSGRPRASHASPFTWVIDPLDGTTNFLHRHPMYAASVAVVENGRPVAGAVVCSTSDEEWWAARGEGAWKKERTSEGPIRIAVSKAKTLDCGLVGTGFPFKSQHLLDEYVQQLARVLRTGSGVRRDGAAAIDLCYVAEGRFDAFWELSLNPWDFAAGMLIVEEAGGLVSRVDGRPLTIEPGGVMAAGTPAMHELLRDLVAGRSER